MKYFIIIFILINDIFAIDIVIDVNEGRKDISPMIYGKNNCLNINSWEFTSEADKQLYRDVGLKLMRENGGNNGTKYNWRNRLSSHPDWYNNVYNNDWDTQAVMIENEFEDMAGLFGFPVLGWAASTNSSNYDEATNDPNNEKTEENLCGDGDPSKYLIEWPTDSVIGILDHWFGDSGLGLSKEKFIYWNLDNEPELWEGTHDDVITSPPHPDSVIERYLTVAKKVKAIDPSIKLCGPAFTNEWQWWAWGRDSLNGIPWIEYFVKRFGEESIKEGVQLIDVIDYHFYPTYHNTTLGNREMLQFHRVWYDTGYSFPQANGVKTSEGGWDNSLTKEYIFKRTEDWINQYFPTDNSVSLGVSEIGFFGGLTPDPNHIACWYASQLGTFADNGVEIFTPWMWYAGMWEIMNLFSNYHYSTRIKSNSEDDTLVSAYGAINESGDSLSIILVNRDMANEQSINISIKNSLFSINDSLTIQTIAELPAEETFKTSTDNALETTFENIISDSVISINIPSLSVTRIGVPLNISLPLQGMSNKVSDVYFNMTNNKVRLVGLLPRSEITLVNSCGQKILSHKSGSSIFEISFAKYSKGFYLLNVKNGSDVITYPFIME